MAPRRKHVIAPSSGREFKLRIPQDISARIEAKAKAEGRPQNRIVINELAEYPRLKQIADLGELIHDMENILLRQGARVTAADLSDELLARVDAVLGAEGNAVAPALDRLRITRNAMRAGEMRKK
jgi:hypothetical protein